MSFLEVTFFNGFQIKAEKQPITRFYSQKTKGLLVYLALEAADRPQTRSHLAGMLWPDFPDSRARRNLSQTLTALRKDLADQARPVSLFYTTTQTIGFNADTSVSIDVLLFESHLSAVHAHSHTSLLLCPDCTHHLEQAAGLYTGPLLDQFDLSDSDLFTNWFVAKRERLLQQAIETFTQLGHNYQAQGRTKEGLQTIDRLLTLAPWQESGHRQRMLLLAQQGQRIQALNQYEILSDVLMSELGVSPAPETDELYDQILSGEIEPLVQTETAVSETGRLVDSPPVLNSPFQAPSISPHFVGREPEIEQMQQLIEANKLELNGPPIALVGMGGIGKTALVTFKAHQLKDRFADGVLWGNPMTSDPLNILDMWARAYGNDFSSLTDLESKATAVRGLLAHKETLIVLDNVEDAAAARHLLPNGGKCQVLMTTRNLDIAGALNAQQVQMRELTTQNSQTLMIRILGEERVLGRPEEAAAAQRIGEQLHHLPLAIEIAAQRLRSRPSMPLAALAMRLEDTQQRMGLKISDQAVRSSFEVSWGGLMPLAQRVFMGMGIFGGRSFAADALTAVTELDLYDLEDELYSLVALSLVNEAGNGRYQQHPLLADFAAEKLAVADVELVTCRERFVSYYLAFVRDAGKDYSQLSPEWDNLTAVIQTAYQTEQWENLIALADSLTPAWQARGRYSQARFAYRFVIEAAQKSGDVVKEAFIWLRWGESALEQNDYEAAEKKLKEGLAGYQRIGDKRGIAHAKYQIARVAMEQNQFDDANKLLLESKHALIALPAETGLGDILFRQGYIAFTDGFRLDDAEPLFTEALVKYEKEKNLVGKIEVLRLQSQVAEKRKNYVDAEILALSAKKLSENLQDRGQLASNLYVLTYIYLGQGKLELAKKCGEESRLILKQTGRKRTEGLVLRQLCRIHKQLGDYEAAMGLIKQSLEVFEMLKINLSQAFSLNELAELYQILGKNKKAKSTWQTAYQLAKQIKHKPLMDSIQKHLN